LTQKRVSTAILPQEELRKRRIAMNTELERLKVTVAGASGVIGSTLCKHLAGAGAEVYGLGRNFEKLREVASSLTSCRGAFVPVLLNSLGPDGWETAHKTILGQAGHIDVFVHAIGVLVPGGVLELRDLEIQKILQTNFVSAVYASRAVLPDMIARGKGQFIVVGSLGGLVPMPYEALYCASKFALRGFCLSLRDELSPTGVHVSLLSPGAVDGAMLKEEGSDWRAAQAFAQPLLEADTVARAAIQLIRSPQAEILVPRQDRALAALMNVTPRLFSIVFPLLRKAGIRRLRRYRKSENPIGSKYATECIGIPI
jgi:short-subunit dehydrogenase